MSDLQHLTIAQIAKAAGALGFAQQHDWGHDAFIAVAIDGSLSIICREAYTKAGKYGCHLASVAPTCRALRHFGGY